MAESEIPEDLMAKAEQVRDLMWLHSSPRSAAKAVAEALLAERERCRLIAAGFDDGGDSGFSQAARTIERIIRQDSPNAPTI